LIAAKSVWPAIFYFLALVVLHAEPIDATLRPITVLQTIDGDTITARYRSDDAATPPITVRLYGIDAPETDQPGGAEATRFVTGWLAGRSLLLRNHGTDQYGRVIGEIFAEGVPAVLTLNNELVGRGLAWWYREYAQDDRALEQLEARARGDNRGLWKQNSPVPPWEWR
jgi:endonuclease YncB( thermonuclease family)